MLYIVGTPIGNLDDLSLRQADIISSSDIVLTEDTRSTGLLLKRINEVFHFPINKNQRLISYYREKEFEKLPEVVELVEKGLKVCLISQAGMPLISDPGYLLVKTIIKKGLHFTVVPGPSAIVNALILSGFNPGNFCFLGFLPRKKSELVRCIDTSEKIREISPEMKIIFFESPNRIGETLKILDERIPERNIAICREMTKKFEEVVRGKPGELLDRNYKGEIVLVID